jgi:hypothetical protein
VLLHAPGGAIIEINPLQVTSLRASEHKGNFTDEARCLVNLVDGKHVAVVEDCNAVRKLIEESR